MGNNRLQLQQFGAEPDDTLAGTPGDGSMAALVLRPIGTLSMIGLMLHGAMGRLSEAAGVERFEFEHLVVRPTLPQGRSGVKVAFDGEVTMMRAPGRPKRHTAARRLPDERPAADFRHALRHRAGRGRRSPGRAGPPAVS